MKSFRLILPRQSHLLALVACAGLFTSCATKHSESPFDDPSLQGDLNNKVATNPDEGFSYWKEESGATEPLRVKIDLSEQAAHFFRGDKQVGRSRVATGLPTHPTPTGSFKITEKIVEKRSTLYGQILDADGNVVKADADSRKDKIPAGGKYLGAEMPYWMRLTNRGIGMHVGPIPNPGSPASHGCIRMPQQMAVKLFENAPEGTAVEIVQ